MTENSKSQKRVKLCALMLYPHDKVPGQRYRLEQWEKCLNELGIEIDHYTFLDEKLMKMLPQAGQIFSKISGMGIAFLRRFGQLFSLKNYDVILVYRAAAMAGPAFFERLIKLTGKPIIYDFDDAIFLTHTHEVNKLFGWAKFAKKTEAICRLSDAVTVGNEWLAEFARQHNSNVSIIPSSVDTEKYFPQAKKVGEKIVVGWTGSSTSQTHLENFAPVLRELSAKLPIEIHVHSDRSPNLGDIPFVWHKWAIDTEVEIISKFDIGIMPMPDDKWSLGKCSMKALIYMSLGVPTVCSDVGMNREVISHGENGYLAKNNEDWFNSIQILVNNQELRNKIGKKSRETIIEKYSMKVCANKFAKVVFETIRNKNK